MLPCVLGIILGLVGMMYEQRAGNGHAAGWAGLSGLWAFVASWTWKRPERRARFVAPGEMGAEAGTYRPLGSHRTPPFMARLRYHPTAVRNEPGLWLLPAVLLVSGLLLFLACAGCVASIDQPAVVATETPSKPPSRLLLIEKVAVDQIAYLAVVCDSVTGNLLYIAAAGRWDGGTSIVVVPGACK